MKVRKLLALSTLFASIGFTTPLLAKEIHKTFDADPGDELVLKTEGGSIEITTHSGNSIEVYASVEGKQEDDFTISFQQSSDGLEIIGEREDHDWGWHNLRVKYEIKVPDHFNLDLDTAGGSIEIDDLTGEIDARTSGGSISVGNINGNVSLNTSGGSISTEDIMGEIDAHTSGGSIRVTFARQPTKNASLTTSGGSITARLPSDVKIELDASTSGGRVRSEFDVNGKIKKQRIRGTINGGGPQLELHTSGGSVHVEKI